MVFLEIVEMGLAIGDHAEQTATGMIVFAMFAEMAGQFVDFLGQEGDLNFGRTAILVMNAGFLDNLAFLAWC